MLFFIIAISFSVIVAIIALRTIISNRAEALAEKISCIPAYAEIHGVVKTHEELFDIDKACFVDITSDLDRAFRDKIISASQGNDLINHYRPYYQEAHALAKWLDIFRIETPVALSKLVVDFEDIHDSIKCHNERVINEILKNNKEFFDHCLKYPLDRQQRRSIVSEEDNCLVVSSAGSGKTSSIVGKVKYLMEIKGVNPKKILMISYTNKAAAELTERLDTDGLKGYTFHKLAIEIIGKVTGIKPSICDNTDSLFVEIYNDLLNKKSFKNSVIDYFMYYSFSETDLERQMREKREKLSEQKNTRLKAMFPDMDGNVVYVRSEQEQKICSALYSLGVKFRYEEPYEHQLADEMHSQYRPDFSIYFEKGGRLNRIYLEHFGIDEHGLVPDWFAKDKNISYEEANKMYNDGITWKKAAHEKFGTRLLVTSSADFRYLDIKEKLRGMLMEAAVPIQEKTAEELYESVLPKGGKQEKSIIRLIITFVTLVKSSCKSIKDILRQADAVDDDRSVFIIKNIFQPVYDRYKQSLNDRNQIDFTDSILRATEICRSSRPVDYDYIIVDEFQDISVDRYNFLKVLRDGERPAKLYCVGDDWQSIYRFSGSDMALFNQFSKYFGTTEINKIETTYRFGEPLVSQSSIFIQRNNAQIRKNIKPFSSKVKTELEFLSYDRSDYCNTIRQIISAVPSDKSMFLLGRYSFDDYYLSGMFQSVKQGDKFYYIIDGRKTEFLTVHKSKGLEADYVILLQCNKDTYGFPSLVSDDPVLNHVLTESDQFPYGEERRLFYVAMTRAKIKTFVLYDRRFPSVFVDEFLRPEKISEESYKKHPNANKQWTRSEDRSLLMMHRQGMTVKEIAMKMGRSQTSIVMRLGKLNTR